MPLYEYQACDRERACPHCAEGFEVLQRMSEEPLRTCPKCGMPVKKAMTAAAVGLSRSGLDDRAKRAGFHKLARLGKGEYEKVY